MKEELNQLKIYAFMAQGLFLFVQKTSVKYGYDFSKILENHKW